MTPDERFLALLDEIAENTEVGRTELLLENYLQQLRESTANNKIQVDTTELEKVLNRLPMFPSEDQIAEAVARIVTIPPQIDFTPTLNEVLEAILALKTTIREVAGGGRNMHGGTGIVRLEENQSLEVSNDIGNPIPISSAALDRVITSTDYMKVEGFDDIEALTGHRYGAGAEVITSVATPHADLTITNPLGSAKRVVLRAWSMYADANATVRFILNGSSTATLRSSFNNAQHPEPPAPSIAEVRAGASAVSGGTTLSHVSRVSTNDALRANGMYISLGPADSWTMRFEGPGATNTVWMNFEWIEKDL